MYVKSNLDLFTNNTFSNDETHNSLKYELEHSFNYLKKVQESYVETDHISKSNADIQVDENGNQFLYIDKSLIDVSSRAKYRLGSFYNKYITLAELLDNTDLFLYVPMVYVNSLLLNSNTIKTTLTEGFDIRFDIPLDLDQENNIEIVILENLAVDRIVTTKDYLNANNYRLSLDSFETNYTENYPMLVYTQTEGKLDAFTALNPVIGTDENGTYLQINPILKDSNIFPVTGEFIIALVRSDYLNAVSEMKELKTRVMSPIQNSVLVALYDEIIVPYLMFDSETAFTLKTGNTSKNWDGILEYSIDGIDWIEWDGVDISSSDTGVMFMRGIGNTYISGIAEYLRFQFTNATNLKCIGNIELLLDYPSVENNIHPVMADACFANLFYYCTELIQAPELPSTIITTSCYYAMFRYCYKLILPPELPATELADNCYNMMFSICLNLVKPAELPSIRMKNNCYSSMYYRCESITYAPALPAMELAENCYSSMFNTCIKLVAPPVLPAMELAENCYDNMFNSCNSLIIPPALPATKLAKNCYNSMFLYCHNILTSPELPAMELAENCYESMFGSCYDLISPPELPATKLAKNCYYSMFSYCRSLVVAPELPATELAENCYNSMFNGCFAIVLAPELPAKKLEIKCYFSMFSSCNALTAPPALPATELADSCYGWMFHRCTSMNISLNYSSDTPVEWKIPSSGSITETFTDWNILMINNTSGSFTGTVSTNTTYYIAENASTPIIPEINIPEINIPEINIDTNYSKPMIKKSFSTPIPESNLFVFAEHKITKEFKYLYGSTVTLHYPNIYEITNPQMTNDYTYKIFYMYKKTTTYLEYDNKMDYIHTYLCEKVGRDIYDVEGMVSDFIYNSDTLNIDPDIKSFFDEMYRYTDYNYIYNILDYEDSGKETLEYKIDRMYDFIEANPISLRQYGRNTQNSHFAYHLYVKNIDLSERIRRDTTQETDKQSKFVYFSEDRYMFGFNNSSNDILQLRFFIDGLLCQDIYTMTDDFVDYLYIPTEYIKADSFIEIEVFDSYEYTNRMIFIDNTTEFNISLPQKNLKPTLFDLYFTDNSNNKLPNNNFKVFTLLDNEVRKFLESNSTLENMGNTSWEDLGVGNSWNAITNEIIQDAVTKEYYINIDTIFQENDNDPDGEGLRYVFLDKLKIFCVEPSLYNNEIIININKQSVLNQTTYKSFTIPHIRLFGNSAVWKKHTSYLRLFLNGRLTELNYDIIEESALSAYIRINNMISAGDTLAIDVTPYSYRLEYSLDTLPDDYLISFNGKLSKPFDFEYYDVYLNDRRLTMDNVQMITPDKIQIFNVKSKNKFRIYRRDRDYEYYGFTYKPITLLDKLLESSFITPEEKKELIDTIIKDNNPDATINGGTDTEPPIEEIPIVTPEDFNLYEFYSDIIVPEGIVRANSFFINSNTLTTRYPEVFNRYPDKTSRLILSANVNGNKRNVIMIGTGPQ